MGRFLIYRDSSLVLEWHCTGGRPFSFENRFLKTFSLLVWMLCCWHDVMDAEQEQNGEKGVGSLTIYSLDHHERCKITSG